MDFLSDINIAGKISIASITSESVSMDALFRNDSSEITKRTLGTMALQATANYYSSIDSDARFLQNVSINLPSIFNVTTSNATPSSSGLVAVLATQPQNTVFAAPTSFNGTPSFRSLVIADTTGLQTALDAKLSGSGSAGYLSKYTGSLALGNSVIYESGGNINIGGSTTPTSRLSFQDNIMSLSGDTVAINLRAGSTAGSLPAYGFGFSNGSASAFLDYRAATFNADFSGHRFLVNNTPLFTMRGDGTFLIQGISGSSVARLKFSPMGVSTEKVLIDLNTGNNTSDGLPAYGIGFGPSSEGYISYRSGQGSTSIYGHKFLINSVESFRLRGDLTAIFNGSVGIGTSTLTNYNFRIQKNITGSSTSHSFTNSGIIQSDVTAGAFYNQTVANTQDASFTLPFIYHNSAQQGIIGAGSSVLTQIGYFAQSSLTGATTNIGFRGAIAAGINRWNAYMDGTASNHFAGNVYIGTTSGTYKLDVTGDVNTSTFYRIGGVRVGEFGQFQTHEQHSSISTINYGASFLYGATDMPGISPQWHVFKLGVGSEYMGHATYLAFGRPFAGYFDGKIYVRGIYGVTDSGWISVGGSGVQDYSYERGETLIQYKGTLIEEVTGDAGVFIGKDIVNGGIIFEMQVSDIDSSDVTIYQNWINPADGRLYYVEPTSPYEKKKYLIEGEGGEGGGSYSGSFPISVSGSVISIATATGSQTGALSSTDWNNFNNKFNLPGGGSDGQVLTKSGGGAVWASVGSGGVYSGASPISISGTTISILTASGSQNGALSSTDWTTFNNKFSVPSGGIDGQVLMKSGSSVVWGSVSSGGGSYTGISPISISGSNISIQQANSTQSGFLSTTDWNTFNDKFTLPSGGTNGQVLKKVSGVVQWADDATSGGGLTATSPLYITSGVVGIQVASGVSSGYLTSAKYIEFNSKLGDGFTSDVRPSFNSGLSFIIPGGSGFATGEMRFAFDYATSITRGRIGLIPSAGVDGNPYFYISSDVNGIILSGGGPIRLSTLQGIYMNDKLIDMDGFATGKILKATSSTRAEWVNP